MSPECRYTQVLASDCGYWHIVANQRAVLEVTWSAALPSGRKTDSGNALTQLVAQEIAWYLAGKLRQFTFPIKLTGTPFALAVYQALQNISYGQTRTYGQIAQIIGKKGATRAVGNACHHNQLLLIIPCHRVVGAQNIGGFGCGVALKTALLSLEKAGC